MKYLQIAIIFFMFCFIQLSQSMEIRQQNRQSLEQEDTSNHRDKKLLSIFNLVRFPNTICNGSDIESGWCISSSHCSNKGGTAYGTCALGFGVCCERVYTCGDASNDKVSYFQNEEYPSDVTLSNIGCTYSLTVEDEDCCQVRIDFETLEMDNVDPASGTCLMTSDFLTIYGNGVAPTGISSWCGSQTGQHVYLHLDTTAMPITIHMITVTNAVDPGRWKIKATVINCNAKSISEKNLEAPNGCTQYFTDTSGIIESIGYVQGSADSPLYPINTEYSICIRKPATARCIQYTFNDVSLGCEPASTTLFQQDHLILPNTADNPIICNPAAGYIYTNAAAGWPYIIFFKSDQLPETVSGTLETGFSIEYAIYSNTECTGSIIQI